VNDFHSGTTCTSPTRLYIRHALLLPVLAAVQTTSGIRCYANSWRRFGCKVARRLYTITEKTRHPVTICIDRQTETALKRDGERSSSVVIFLPHAQRGVVLLSAVFVCVGRSVCLSVCLHDNSSTTVRDIVTKFSWHDPMVEGADKFDKSRAVAGKPREAV